MNFNRLAALCNKHRGKIGVLICNGPSLNKTDFAGLDKGHIIFGLNKIFLAADMAIPKIDYLVAVNEKVLKQSFKNLIEHPSVKILGNRAGDLIEESDTCYYFNSIRPNVPRFSIDPIFGVHEGWTVTHAALQIIFFMGIRKVVIVGMDHNFLTDGSPPNSPGIVTGPDMNHFSENYFGFGQLWDLPDLKQSEISYTLAKQVFEAYGGLIIDATINGRCQVFRKETFQDALCILRQI